MMHGSLKQRKTKMDFTKAITTFLEENPRLSRDERNIWFLAGYMQSCGIIVTPENASILLEAFVRTNHDKLFWNAVPEPESKPVKQALNKRYNPAEELQQAREQRAKQRENVQKNAELMGKRAAFESEMRKIASWKEFRNGQINWAATFSEIKARYAALAKAHPSWAAECDAAAARVGK